MKTSIECDCGTAVESPDIDDSTVDLSLECPTCGVRYLLTVASFGGGNADAERPT